MMKIGIVGAGTMGALIAGAIDRGEIHGRLVAIADREPGRAEALAAGMTRAPVDALPAGIEELIDRSDLVVEAAGADAVREVLPLVVERGRDIVILSIGALIDLDDTIRRADRTGTTIYCPSGAVAGLDALKAAAAGRIESAAITTRKPPAGLAGAPYLVERGIDLGNLSEPVIVFEGSAREACRAFPANINVAAALSLAGLGVDRTRVSIVADPHITRNTHRVEIRGDAGTITTVTENVPSENPRTSRLAALSAIALLAGLTRPLRIGT